ncbi:metallophosphoesterase [Luteirhabdus pelagi]|uniref:metallophosphoesterase n=1 Tax=Luteirhabdus pelagi TaxID=2792783 RepID=UPI00193A1160|nr:metallophosphoesterase [Luteirhabdus pelagi]
MVRWIIFIAIYIVVDIYAYQAFRTLSKSNWLLSAYILVSLFLLGSLIYQLEFNDSTRTMTPARMYVFGFFLAIFVPKLLVVLVMALEDIIRLFVGLFSKFGGNEASFYMPSRRTFVSTIALTLAAIPFASLLYGMYRGKYNYQVLKYALEFDDLPEAFDGYTLTQISDIHSGSFDNEEKVKYAVNLVNEQKSDMILFTGDLVNNLASEMDNWQSVFSELNATDGIYSVLGNHDYGDYIEWSSREAQAENLERLKNMQRDMGWELLLNENRTISKNGETIKLIGVENWGAGGFKKAGDLEKACEGVEETDFKILMSHDPSHWQAQVKEHPKNIQLTLSGHTHGMQFGIEIPGLIKWSPVKYRYENWAGLYEELGRFIHVNRGFGYLGYPGRVGMWPEITVLTLKKKRNTA